MADIREESSEAWASKSRDSSWEFRYNGLGYGKSMDSCGNI
jgi:hypothetical protein